MLTDIKSFCRFIIIKVVEDLDIPVISTLHEYFSLWNFDPFDKMENMLVSKPQWYVELIRNKHELYIKLLFLLIKIYF